MSKMLFNSERKFTLTMTPIEGVTLSQCRLVVEVYKLTGSTMTLPAENILPKDDNSVKIILTNDLLRLIGKDPIKMQIHIGIPDPDFPDGYRDQIYEICE